jgi:hypothetical protein
MQDATHHIWHLTYIRKNSTGRNRWVPRCSFASCCRAHNVSTTLTHTQQPSNPKYDKHAQLHCCYSRQTAILNRFRVEHESSPAVRNLRRTQQMHTAATQGGCLRCTTALPDQAGSYKPHTRAPDAQHTAVPNTWPSVSSECFGRPKGPFLLGKAASRNDTADTLASTAAESNESHCTRLHLSATAEVPMHALRIHS